MPSDSKRSLLDRVAVVLSSICMLHCLALPFLLTLAPITQGAFLDEQVFHILMLVLILPVSVIALTIGCRKHKDPLTMVLGSVGLVVLAITAFFGHDWFGMTGERIVTSLGGLILAGAHIQNYRICRHNDCHHEH
jgi:hypothetical protein